MLATAMIFCVVPPELADELFDKLTRHYADDPNVTVIIDQRTSERREQGAEPPIAQRRELRDPAAGASPATSPRSKANRPVGAPPGLGRRRR